ncbi:MAG: PH domain-containing protein, partial [Candidatus Kapabacteria bacterium]|nr:PH domain-containing protein [Candidatus Kapabacteria bacterium]
KYDSNIVSGYIEETVDSFADLPIELLLPLSVAFLILTVVMSWIVDIVWTFLQYYGFKLVKDGNKLVESYGLLSRNSVTIPLPKLQQITIATNPVKIKFNFYTLLLHTAGFDVYKKNASSGIPLAKKEDLLEIASDIYPVQIPESFRNISRKAVRRAFVRYLIFLIIPMAAAYYMIDWYFLSGLILIPLVYYGAVLRWQYRGYNISDNLIFVKHGFWNQKLNIIPVDKLQTLHVRASFFQRRLGLATVVIDTAASISAYDAVIPDIDADDAVMILEEINEAFLQKSRVIN